MSGVLISVACTYFFAKGEFAEQLVRMSNEFDKRYTALQTVNTDLNTTIKDKLGPMATQVEEVKDQLPELSDKVDSVEKTANAAATRSTRAANSARKALRKPAPIYIPHGSQGIRLKERPACIRGKDLYDDPC